MAKREKKQAPVKMTRKHLSRIERERRQLRYIYIGTGVVVAIIILLVVAAFYTEKVANPAATRRAEEATRRAEEALKSVPAVTVNDAMISMADWRARVRFERLLHIDQIAQISQQLNVFDRTTEFGQQMIEQGQAQIQQISSLLDSGDGIAADVLDQMVEEQLIRQEAARRGITVTPEELQRYIEVDVFEYPYPPTPEPIPTLPPPTLPPTATVTPEPTLTPTTPPTPRSREEFEARYRTSVDQVQEIAGMTEEMWRTMIEGELYRQKLLDAFGAEIETNVQQVKGRYIVTEDQEAAGALLARLEAGETFEELEEEINADESEEPVARTGLFDWSPLESVQERFGEEFATVAFDTDAGTYAGVVIAGPLDRFYLVFLEGNETRELSSFLIEQQRQEHFQTWLDEGKRDGAIEYGNWRDYIPREPSL